MRKCLRSIIRCRRTSKISPTERTKKLKFPTFSQWPFIGIFRNSRIEKSYKNFLYGENINLPYALSYFIGAIAIGQFALTANSEWLEWWITDLISSLILFFSGILFLCSPIVRRKFLFEMIIPCSYVLIAIRIVIRDIVVEGLNLYPLKTGSVIFDITLYLLTRPRIVVFLPIYVIVILTFCSFTIAYTWGKYDDYRVIVTCLSYVMSQSMVLMFLMFFDKLYRKNFIRTAILKEKQMKINEEDEKTHELLQNILPKFYIPLILEGLLKDKNYILRTVKDGSIMVSDLIDFTGLCSETSCEEIVFLLDRHFTVVDFLTNVLDLEKVKTVGDAYLILGGLKEKFRKEEKAQDNGINQDIILEDGLSHAARSVIAGICLIRSLQILNKTYRWEKEFNHLVAVRVGVSQGVLHCVVFGKYGNLSFDVYGKTVGEAYKCESSSEKNCLQVNEEIFNRTRLFFNYEYREETNAYIIMNAGDISRSVPNPSLQKFIENIVNQSVKKRKDINRRRRLLKRSTKNIKKLLDHESDGQSFNYPKYESDEEYSVEENIEIEKKDGSELENYRLKNLSDYDNERKDSFSTTSLEDSFYETASEFSSDESFLITNEKELTSESKIEREIEILNASFDREKTDISIGDIIRRRIRIQKLKKLRSNMRRKKRKRIKLFKKFVLYPCCAPEIKTVGYILKAIYYCLHPISSNGWCYVLCLFLSVRKETEYLNFLFGISKLSYLSILLFQFMTHLLVIIYCITTYQFEFLFRSPFLYSCYFGLCIEYLSILFVILTVLPIYITVKRKKRKRVMSSDSLNRYFKGQIAEKDENKTELVNVVQTYRARVKLFHNYLYKTYIILPLILLNFLVIPVDLILLTVNGGGENKTLWMDFYAFFTLYSLVFVFWIECVHIFLKFWMIFVLFLLQSFHLVYNGLQNHINHEAIRTDDFIIQEIQWTALVVIFFIFGMYIRDWITRGSFDKQEEIKKKNEMIVRNKTKNERIILSVLPKDVVNQIMKPSKTNTSEMSKLIKNCCVCFVRITHINDLLVQLDNEVSGELKLIKSSSGSLDKYSKDSNEEEGEDELVVEEADSDDSEGEKENVVASLAKDSKRKCGNIVDSVSFLVNLFLEFDEILKRCECQKIKSIQEAYLFISEPRSGKKLKKEEKKLEEDEEIVVSNQDDDKVEEDTKYIENVITAAQLCLRKLEIIKSTSAEFRDSPVSLKIGVHVGKVSSGVVGTSKFLFDIFGDSVNIAARLCFTSSESRIQVLEDVTSKYPKIFDVESRGMTALKGLGNRKTMFINIDDDIQTPNGPMDLTLEKIFEDGDDSSEIMLDNSEGKRKIIETKIEKI